MWNYHKTLEYPINVKNKNPRLAKFIISQYGGPDGELAASLRYLSQRFGMPDQKAKAILNDIGTEELAHVEMICTMVYQMMKGATPEEKQPAVVKSEEKVASLSDTTAYVIVGTKTTHTLQNGETIIRVPMLSLHICGYGIPTNIISISIQNAVQ